jgi:hypothetical protein
MNALANFDHLVEVIVEKSESVFLWLAVVTQNLRQGPANGWEAARIEAELKRLPQEMEDLFEYLFTSIPDLDRRRAYQILAMVLKFEPYESKLFSLACLYLDDFEQDPNFALKIDAQKNDLVVYRNDKARILELYTERTTKAQKVIHRYCRGLVEIRYRSAEKQELASSENVLFVHRSAVEFIEEHMKTAPDVDKLADAEVIELISRLHLAAFLDSNVRFLCPNHWSQLYTDIIHMRALGSVDREPYVYLERLTLAIQQKFPAWLEYPTWNTFPVEVFRDSSNGMVAVKFRISTTTFISRLRSPIHLTAYIGTVDYAQWKLKRHPHLAKDPCIGADLLQCLRCGLRIDELPSNLGPYKSCVEILLPFTILDSVKGMSWVQCFYCAVRSIKEESGELATRDSDSSWDDSAMKKMNHSFAMWFIDIILEKVKRINLDILNNRTCANESGGVSEGYETSQLSEQGTESDAAQRNPWFNSPREGLHWDPSTEPLSLRQYFQLWDLPYKEATVELLDGAYAPITCDDQEKIAVVPGDATNVASGTDSPLPKTRILRDQIDELFKSLSTIFSSQKASTSETNKESTSAPGAPCDHPEHTPKKLGYLLKLHGGQWHRWIYCSIFVVVGVLGMFFYCFLDLLLTRAREHRYSMRDGSFLVWLEMMR